MATAPAVTVANRDVFLSNAGPKIEYDSSNFGLRNFADCLGYNTGPKIEYDSFSFGLHSFAEHLGPNASPKIEHDSSSLGLHNFAECLGINAGPKIEYDSFSLGLQSFAEHFGIKADTKIEHDSFCLGLRSFVEYVGSLPDRVRLPDRGLRRSSTTPRSRPSSSVFRKSPSGTRSIRWAGPDTLVQVVLARRCTSKIEYDSQIEYDSFSLGLHSFTERLGSNAGPKIDYDSSSPVLHSFAEHLGSNACPKTEDRVRLVSAPACTALWSSSSATPARRSSTTLCLGLRSFLEYLGINAVPKIEYDSFSLGVHLLGVSLQQRRPEDRVRLVQPRPALLLGIEGANDGQRHALCVAGVARLRVRGEPAYADEYGYHRRVLPGCSVQCVAIVLLALHWRTT